MSCFHDQCPIFFFDTLNHTLHLIWNLLLAAQFPTIVVYLMDTVRSTNPVTFMSNMLYACSILYKTKLPFIVAMNKIDVVDNKYAVEWMEDFEIFQVKLMFMLPNQWSYHKFYMCTVLILNYYMLLCIGSIASRKILRFKSCTIYVLSTRRVL